MGIDQEKKNLYFHIGAPKTATTFLQQALNHNKNHLQKMGYDVLLPHKIRKTAFFDYVFSEHTNRESKTTINSAQKDLYSIIRNCQCDKVILSEEGFTQHLMPTDNTGKGFAGIQKTLEAIKTIAPQTSKIILTIRNQVDYIESIYKHKIKWKFCSLPLNEYLDRHIDVFNVSWANVISELEDYFPNKVEVIPFELIKSSQNKFLYCFLRSVNLSNSERLIDATNEVKNESLADNHALFMRSLNHSIKQLESFNMATRPKIKVRFVNEMLADEPKKKLPEFQLSNAVSDQIKSYYHNENQALLNKYCTVDNFKLVKKYY